MKTVYDANDDAQKKRAAIKLANELPLNVSQVIITGGGAGLFCTDTLQETLTSCSDQRVVVSDDSFSNSHGFIDPKGSASVMMKVKNTFSELMQGRIAYGEWMKHLLVNDKPPRGKCSAYFKKNADLRQALAGTSVTRWKQRSIMAKMKIDGHI